jgi:hypothetical protein
MKKPKSKRYNFSFGVRRGVGRPRKAVGFVAARLPKQVADAVGAQMQTGSPRITTRGGVVVEGLSREDALRLVVWLERGVLP